LSGLGGDELLAGYDSFRTIPRWVRWMRGARAIPGLGQTFRHFGHRSGLFADIPKAVAMAEYGGTFSGAYLLRRGIFLPHELHELLDGPMARDGLERLSVMAGLRAIDAPARAQGSKANDLARVAALESSVYMRNQLLKDADWAGMAHSIEIRTPMVDQVLLQRLAPIQPHLGRLGAGKDALAKAPRAALPNDITGRRKTGFGVPTGHWAAGTNFKTRGSKGLASRSWAREVFGHFPGPNQLLPKAA
jgi:asparagine synthase (glutamine-hydrolysing)